MQAKAVARTVRIAPRKARLVMDLIRGKQVGEAVSILNLTPKAASPIIEKVLKSAIANAEHNYELDANSLVITQAFVDEGPTLKRFRPSVLWVVRVQLTNVLATLQSLYQKRRRDNPWVKR
ncbi:50S ribosomal protein L22 [Bacillus safensis]|uniref:Large ribosomal subunit protein uL22 n=1 Tax=Bacillus safensis TaxID=561879 RepID=A0A5S9LYZ7_BACIA|nr:50S ribosomal protein L22 [Bacillus safensis]